jgi:hypothetical protein
MTKQYPAAAFARANITPNFSSTRTYYTDKERQDALALEIANSHALAEIAELGSKHPCNYASQINCGQEKEGAKIYRSIRTPGTLWQPLEDYDDPSNSWV